MTKTPRKTITHGKTGKQVVELGVETTPAAQRVTKRAPVTPSALKVAELKAELQARGLSPAGLKKDLVERLEEAIKNDDHVESEDAVVEEKEIAKDESVEHDEKTIENAAAAKDEPLEEEVVPLEIEPAQVEALEEEKDALQENGHAEVKVDYDAEEAKQPESANGEAKPESVKMDAKLESAKRAAEEESLPMAKHAKTGHVLHIIGFVRPLMVQSVQELLGQFGNVEDFWMDSIKSHCFVSYDEEEAVAKCREALEGTVWPKETGKALSVIASNAEEFEAARAAGDRKLGPDDLFLKTEFKPSIYYLPATGVPPTNENQ